ncbi:MAG TPA: hypothetical protein QF480_09705 [Bacteroidales bacterium]|jgi:uncharacterized membrane protein YjjP (DUF1212 family)|nr:hypothetical protein [Bacteroidales bacterium]|tara:strand:+ start:1032 stop:1472 length:441 start_codon:yes stop_codon:yes gene_type:complete
MEKYLLLAIFGIAMAHFEGVVVVYLRKALGIDDAQTNKDLLKELPKRYITIEKTREAATIVMLVALALLVGSTWLDMIIVFLWTFAFWDLFYYLSLYLIIRWPPKFTTIDILFLIPRPWIAPVWFPISVSSITILIILGLLLTSVV